MREVEASIEIAAPVERVWKVLSDFGSYPEWNRFMTRMVGEVKPEAMFRATAKPPGRKEISFDTQLVKVSKEQSMEFHSAYVKGLLYGKHFFNIEKVDQNNTRFNQGIIYSGALRPMVSGIMRDTQTGLEQMNLALKQRCEKER